MSSEQLADGVNPLDAELAATWDVLKGYSGRDTDLGIARRFGGAAAAYSLRDIGAMNGRVVKVRRDSGETTDPEENFSANQVSSGALEDWVNGKLESTLPADVATAAAAYSLRKVKSSYSGNAIRIRRNTDLIEVDVAFDADGKVSTSSSVTNVAEPFGVERGSTSATTLGGYLTEGGTNYDAFVVTWYDQAGSKDAFQLTADKQPQIASSGALLADGIKFNGSTTSLATGTQVLTANETGSQSIYAVCNVTDGASGYIAGSADDDSSGKIGQSIYYYTTTDVFALSNGSTATNTTVDRISAIYGSNVLVSFNYNNNNANTLNQNANQNGYSSGSDAYDFEAGSNFVIGARGGTVQAGRAVNGSIQEVIAYTSDQSDNRFKIESNINNYYGLYNDANEFASDETAFRFLSERSGGTSASSDLTQFTLDVQTASAYAGAKLSEDVLNGDAIYVSFNCSFDSGSPSPKIALRDIDSALNGGVRSNEENVNEGFNSFILTSNNDTASGIVWSEGDDNVIFSVTDFKVSRIARNGFVETWYDQSANQRDAIQGTATNQPSIVQNGGIVKLNSKPTITFDGNDNFLEVDGTGSAVAYSFSPSGDFGMFIVSKQSVGNVADSRDAGGDGIFLQQASANTTRFRYNASANNIDVTATRDAQHYSTMTLDGTTLSGSVDGGTAVTKTVTAGVSTTKNLVLGKAFSGNNSNFLDGEIQEAIFYENSKSSDKSEIETDIDNFYSIT